MFDPEELQGVVSSTRVIVTGDFTLEKSVSGHFESGFFVPDSKAIKTAGASRVAQSLGSIGFDVVSVGVVNEDKNFMSLQEMLYTHTVDVEGLKTGFNLPTNVITSYESDGKRIISSAEVNSHVFTKEYLELIKKHAQDAEVCVFVENQFRSMTKDVMLEALNICRERDIYTVVIPYSTGQFSEDSRYFHADLIIGSLPHLMKLIQSFQISNKANIGISELERLASTATTGKGGVVCYGGGYFVSNRSEIAKSGNRLDVLPALATAGVLVSLGYSFDQAAYFADKVQKGRSLRDLVGKINDTGSTSYPHH